MTEDAIAVSLFVSLEKTRIHAQSASWINVISAASEGIVKARIIHLLEEDIIYNSEMDAWFPYVPEKLSGVKERIALALLLTHPNRISRSMLSTLSSVKAGSLANYLTKEELGVTPYIEESEDGLLLSTAGCVWSSQILKSIENREGEKASE